MKTKILLLLTSIAILLACEVNKTTNEPITESDLIGNWNLTSMTMEGGTIKTVSKQGDTISRNCSINLKDTDMVFLCADNPKMVSVEGRLTSEITISHSTTTNIIDQIFDTNIDSISSLGWKLNTVNTITIARQPELVFSIEGFFTNSLKLSTQVNETRTIMGEAATIEGTLNIVLEK